ncbi:hypothetical protein FNV43_RR03611 [Rhamnella rubrinervis]|uniref:Uncharacterized protein n=1 Tax=Rhamnella rubrinervis TaxID=2594499 RepID=A0A8K0HJ66_9ROSA|nr:hypothetical protein FNV43_RR03611 [Rhamnella rubrinervis]
MDRVGGSCPRDGELVDRARSAAGMRLRAVAVWDAFNAMQTQAVAKVDPTSDDSAREMNDERRRLLGIEIHQGEAAEYIQPVHNMKVEIMDCPGVVALPMPWRGLLPDALRYRLHGQNGTSWEPLKAETVIIRRRDGRYQRRKGQLNLKQY